MVSLSVQYPASWLVVDVPSRSSAWARKLRSICASLCSAATPVYPHAYTQADILEGKNAGVRTVAVLSGAQRKKYLIKADPDFLLDSILALPLVIPPLSSTPSSGAGAASGNSDVFLPIRTVNILSPSSLHMERPVTAATSTGRVPASASAGALNQRSAVGGR